jgi:hypothetical protein
MPVLSCFIFFTYSYTQKMEAICSSETSGDSNGLHDVKSSKIQLFIVIFFENLKSCVMECAYTLHHVSDMETQTPGRE